MLLPAGAACRGECAAAAPSVKVMKGNPSMTDGNRRTHQHDGCSFAYRVTGDGPPVLFVQGVGVHGDGWRPQTDELAASFRCLTFDNRGIGGSQGEVAPLTVARMARDALALLDAASWPTAHVVGHSLGGLVALELAQLAPHRVRSLSLLCTFARGRSAGASLRMAWIGARSRIGTRRMRRRAFLEIVYPPAFLRAHDRDALAADLAPIFGHDLADTPAVTGAQLAAMRGADATPRLRELAAIPTLVTSGAHDPIAPPRLGRALADGLPGATFVLMQDAAHGVPIQFATETNRMLREHLGAAERRS